MDFQWNGVPGRPFSSTFGDRSSHSGAAEELGRVAGLSDGHGKQDLLGFPVGLHVSSEP